MEPADLFAWIGATIDGKVAVEAVSGEGAFAVVYRARHLGLDEPVAVKCLKIPAQMTERDRASLVASFRTEARVLHRLSRRTATIVQALDVGAAVAPNGAWCPYIVMEWLDGRTLRDDLAGRSALGLPPRSIEEAIELLSPAAQALNIAHAEGVVHRNLKPTNLFLADAARNPGAPAETMLKVLDFGIAKMLLETQSRSGASSAGGLPAFTPQYAAPEQFSNQFGTTGPWTDVFAMGLVLIELASGAAALDGADMLQLYVACVDERLRPSLARRGVAVKPAVDGVLRRAVEVQPDRRFADLGEMWRALDEALASRSVLVHVRGSSEPPPSAHDPTLWQRPLPEPRPGAAPTLQRGASDAHPPQAIGARGSSPPGPPGEHPSTPPSSRLTGSQGENRICTVVFVSIEGSSPSDRPGAPFRLEQVLEPDQMKELYDRCFGIVKERIEARGGLVERVAGDSMTAVFGVPRASDNDAERAVHAALDLEAALGAMALPTRALRGWRPSARVGIGTGRVFSRMSPTGAATDVTVVGDAVNVAARLQKHAPPGAVVVGGGTYRQIAGLFQVEPIPRTSTGAISTGETGNVFRVLRPSASRPLVASTDFYGLSTEFVGRSAELMRLSDALETVRSEGRAQVLTLVGAPGVGRTRLLAELSAAWGKDAAILAAQSSPLSGETSYTLASALLRTGFRLAGDETADELCRKLHRGLRALGQDADPSVAPARTSRTDPPAFDAAEVDALVPTFETLLGGRPDGTPSSRDAIPSEGAPHVHTRLSAAVARLLGYVAATRPVVLLCDDLQWADDASLDLLDDLALRLADAPLLVVCTARQELFDRRPHWGEGKPSHRRLELEPLARRHVEQMARDRLRKVPEIGADFVRLLCDRAEGSALILDETLHLLADIGVLEPGPEAWAIHEEALGSLNLPPTIQGIVQARLDRLPSDARATLAQAAVVGRTFWRGAVEAVGAAEGFESTTNGQAAGRSPDRPLEDVLAELRARRLVRVREASTVAGEQELVFAEAATQEVAYAALGVRVRRALHRAAAAWLAQRAKSDAAAALLAQHYERAGDRGSAAAALTRAAAHATALGRHEQALRHLERARSIHDDEQATWGDSSDPAVSLFDAAGDGRVASWRDRTRLRIDLGDAMRALGQLEGAARAYEEARGRVLRGEARSGETWHASETLLWEARIDFRQALVQKLSAAYGEARVLAERAIARATEAGMLEETPSMWALLASIHRREGDDAGWRDACLAGLRVCRNVVVRNDRFREAVSTLLMTLGGLYYTKGRLVRAERLYRQAARVVDEATAPQAAAFALSDAGAVRFARGDVRGAHELFVRALRLKERQGDLSAIAIALSNVAEVELRLGSTDAALDRARRAVRLADQVGALSDLPDMLKNLAQASLASGLVPEALEAGARALSLARVGGGRVYFADVALAVAELCVAASAADGGAHAEPARGLARALSDTLADPEAPGLGADRAERCRELLQSIR